MKRLFCILALLFAGLPFLLAQTSLVRVFKPVESSKYNTDNTYLSGASVSSAFKLGSPSGGLIADGIKGTAVFNVNGSYDKLSFAVGPNMSGEGFLNENSIVTIKADGRIIFDEVIFASDAPRFFTLDISGANQLVFTVFKGSVSITFANVMLWKSGQTVSNPNYLYPKVPSGKVKLVGELPSYFIIPGGKVKPVAGDKFKTSMSQEKTISVSGKTSSGSRLPGD